MWREILPTNPWQRIVGFRVGLTGFFLFSLWTRTTITFAATRRMPMTPATAAKHQNVSTSAFCGLQAELGMKTMEKQPSNPSGAGCRGRPGSRSYTRPQNPDRKLAPLRNCCSHHHQVYPLKSTPVRKSDGTWHCLIEVERPSWESLRASSFRDFSAKLLPNSPRKRRREQPLCHRSLWQWRTRT
jgi:hypothetical protein